MENIYMFPLSGVSMGNILLPQSTRNIKVFIVAYRR